MTAPTPQLIAVDLVIQRKKNEKILFIRRKNEPFQGKLALPGGFVDPDETTEAAARRELLEETGVKVQKLQFIGVSSEPDRDPRSRVISLAYYASVPERTKATAGDDAADAVWLTAEDAVKQGLAFDHEEILMGTLEEDA